MPLRSVRKRRTWLLPAAVIALSVITPICSNSQHVSDSLRNPTWAILHIGRINADCYGDTLLGSRSARGGYLPRLIAWGQPPQLPKDDKRKRDSLIDCMGPFAAAKKKLRATTFSYPAWEDLGGTVAVGRFNRNDTLPDLVITIWGRYRDARGKHDTTHMVCLFSQHALDTVRTIDMGNVGEERREKFAARRLGKNAGLVRPGARDLSGGTSWELDPVTFELEESRKNEDTKRNDGSPRPPLLNELREEATPPRAQATQR